MKIVVKEDVYSDLTEIVKWYKEQSKGLGIKFLNEWEISLNFIAENPFAFQIKYKNFRDSKITRFPYLIIFEIENSTIIVYAVIHTSREPQKRYKEKISNFFSVNFFALRFCTL